MFEIIMFWISASVFAFFTLIGPWFLMILIPSIWVDTLLRRGNLPDIMIRKIEGITDRLIMLPFNILRIGAKDASQPEGLHLITWLGSIVYVLVASVAILASSDQFVGMSLAEGHIHIISTISMYIAKYTGWLIPPVILFATASWVIVKGAQLYTDIHVKVEKVLNKESDDV